jgi:hypothetical protein
MQTSRGPGTNRQKRNAQKRKSLYKLMSQQIETDSIAANHQEAQDDLGDVDVA